MISITGSGVILWNDDQLMTEWGSTMLKQYKELSTLLLHKITFLKICLKPGYYICIAGCLWPQNGERAQSSISSLTFSLHQPPSLSSIAETIITYPYPCYPSLNLSPSTRSIQQSGSLWLLAGHPTPPPPPPPLPVSQPSSERLTASRANQ